MLEEFVYTWLALENMAGEKEVRKRCPHCDNELEPYKAANRGKAFKIVNSSDPKVDSATFHQQWWDNLRNDIFHGKKRLDSNLLIDLNKVLDRLQPAVESYIERELAVTLRRGPKSASDTMFFASWNYLEFGTRQPQSEFAPDPPDLARFTSIIEQKGITWAEQEAGCHLLSASDFEIW
jgi:hypothetical protein